MTSWFGSPALGCEKGEKGEEEEEGCALTQAPGGSAAAADHGGHRTILLLPRRETARRCRCATAAVVASAALAALALGAVCILGPTFGRAGAAAEERDATEMEDSVAQLVGFSSLPLLFCWMVVRPVGYELPLVMAQQERGAGVFACDDTVLVSSEDLGFPSYIRTLFITTTDTGGKKTSAGTIQNQDIFLEAWDQIRVDGGYLNFDWVVKCDPDTVLVPHRLRQKLSWENRPTNPYPPPYEEAPHRGKFVPNCDLGNPANGDRAWPMMFGAIEIISRYGLQTYFANVDECVRVYHDKNYGEDTFMGMCLRHLQLGEVFLREADNVCKGAKCDDRNFEAYHPYKSIESWLMCLDATGEGR